MRRSREASEALVSAVSSEVDRQLGERGLKNFDLDDLAQRVAAIITMAGNAGRTATSARSDTATGQGDGAATKKTSASKSSAPKSSAKSSGKSSPKASAKKKDSARASGDKSSSKNPKGSSSKKSESKKVSTLSAADETAGTAT